MNWLSVFFTDISRVILKDDNLCHADIKKLLYGDIERLNENFPTSILTVIYITYNS